MSLPVIVQHRLDNGLRVVLAPEHRVPVVSISLWYGVGSSHERPGRSGFAHLFEHMMFQGSAHVAKGEHFGLIQAAGGRSNASTLLDATVYTETLPSHELELPLWLEADRLRTLVSALSQETLDNQRDVVKNERRNRVDNVPYGAGEEKIFALAFPASHPYHHSPFGSMDDISAASLDDVRSFFATYYVPNNAVLTIIGDLDTDQTLELVRRHFGTIPPGADAPPPDGDLAVPHPGGMRAEVDERVPLARVYVGCPAPPLGDPGFDVADLMTDLLTTGRASRLQAKLLREERLALAVDAWIEPLIRGAGMLIIEATARDGVGPDDLEAGLTAELDRLAQEPPPDDELQRVRLTRATHRMATMEKAEGRAQRIGMYASLLNDPGRFATDAERDLAIDPEAVRTCAQRWLREDNRALLWYRPSGG